MAWTSHGHQIIGTIAEEPVPSRRMRCGGPGLCPICSAEAAAATKAARESENTLYKVHDALHDSGLNHQQIQDAINSLQNYGILFRERA